MYFDQHGKVRACCQNTGIYLGDVTRQSLREIWESAAAERIRTALEHDDYSAGCEFCEWQVREGNDATVFARSFDELKPVEHRLHWPRQMEFSLTNTCNLQCVMCNGDWSSAIRAKREKRAPLPTVYSEDFYEQLAEFLPHLDEVEFLGGEPFLGSEPLRVMEMLAELDCRPQVTLTTNGTIMSSRVERILASVRPHIVVSLDGASPATYDSIRQGAHFEAVISNLDRFRDVLGPGHVSITTCLMTNNWHEFAAVLHLAERRDLVVGINVVRFPSEHSLYQLPAEELEQVVGSSEETEVHLSGRRLEQRTGQIQSLVHRLATMRADDETLGPTHGPPRVSHGVSHGPHPSRSNFPIRRAWLPFPDHATGTGGTEVPGADLATLTVTLDLSGSVTVEAAQQGAPIPADGLDGAPESELARRLTERFGRPHDWIAAKRACPEDDDRYWLWLGHHDQPPEAEVVGVALRDDEGNLIGARCTIRGVTRAAGESWPAGEPRPS